ncbi:MAG: hypothetical protein KJO18_09390 [Acidimicrobiia bacterium]|nr:hypothetical protein [Acidimicrobiia bacterium]
MAYQFSSDTLRDEARHLRDVAGETTYVRSRALYLLGVVGRYSGSLDGLWPVAPGADARAADLEARAQFLDDYQLGWATFALPSGVAGAAAGRLLSPTQMAEAMAELQLRIDTWSGGDNHPLLDEMVRDLNQLQRDLGVSPEQLARLAEAILTGLSPSEARLPEWLFPQWYLDAVVLHESGSALISDLEAQETVLEQRYDELSQEFSWLVFGGYDPDDPDRLSTVVDEIKQLDAEFDVLRDQIELAKASLSPMPTATMQTVFNHLLASPFVGYVESRQASAAFLALLYSTTVASEDYETLTWIAATLASGDVSSMTAAHFFNVIGVDAASDIPDFLADTGSIGGANYVLRPDQPRPGDVIEMFSIALAKASKSQHLDFTGAELIDSNISRSGLVGDAYVTVYDASYLFMAGGFSKRFVVSATARYLPYAQSPLHAMDQIWTSDGLLTLDSRGFLFAEVARHGAGADLMLALGEVGILLNPANGAAYNDEPVLDALSLALAGIPAMVDPAAGMPRADAVKATEALLISAGENGIAPGLEPAVALILGPYMNAVVPGDDYESPTTVRVSVDVDRSSPLALSDAQVDAALAEILASPIGASVLYQLATVYSTYELMKADDAGVPLVLLEDDLGNLFGRLRSIELQGSVSEAEQLDAANAWMGLIATTGISMLTAAAFPPSWPLAAGVVVSGLTSAGGSTLFPASNHLEQVYGEALYSLGDDVIATQYASTVALVDSGALELPDGLAIPPLPPDDASVQDLEAWDESWADFAADYRAWVGTGEASTLAELPIETVLSIFALSLLWLEPQS